MPSWSFRSNNNAQPSTPPATSTQSSSFPFHLPGSGHRSVLQDAPTLSSSMNNSGSPGSAPIYHRGHSRSISHPNPSPFSGNGRKHDKLAVPKNGYVDSDDDDDDFIGLVSSSPRKGGAGGGTETGGGVGPARATGPADDFLTGRCMTCNSTVRWPRSLKVFRCTACLTVNDLEPYKELPELPDEKQDQSPPVKSYTLAVPSVSRKGAPLSVERTRAIIENCVASYLRKVLEHATSGVTPTSTSLPAERRSEKSSVPTERGHLSPATSRLSARTPSPKRPIDTHQAHIRRSSAVGRSGTAHPDGREPQFLTPPPLGMRSRSMENRSWSVSDLRSTAPRGAADADAKEHAPAPSTFKALEDHIVIAFKGCDTLNSSFTTARPQNVRAVSDGNPPRMKAPPSIEPSVSINSPVFEPDAKTLLLGDLGENSSWWMIDWVRSRDGHANLGRESPKGQRLVTSRSPRINWSELAEWYHLVLSAGSTWMETWAAMAPSDDTTQNFQRWASIDMSLINKDITEARVHAQKTLLKATETLLKRPRRPLKRPDDARFLLILLANPLLYPSSSSTFKPHAGDSAAIRTLRRPSHPMETESERLVPVDSKSPSRRTPPVSSASRSAGAGQHAGIIKRILGLMANLPDDCHHYLLSWFSRLPERQFERMVELVGGFVTYRLVRQHGRKRSQSSNNGSDLIPSFASAAGSTPAELHAAINGRSPGKAGKKEKEKPVLYAEDWQVRAAARVMSVLFLANDAHAPRKADGSQQDDSTTTSPESGKTLSRHDGSRHGSTVAISTFYNTLLDYSDLVADFEAWEGKSSKFTFCQYPFFLSIWAKIHIMEHDARRQMEVKAREAFFNSILNRTAISQYLVLKVRRDCLVEDSLRRVSEVVGSGEEEIKKGLRIEFLGEEGVDAGGLRKEWFLLLVREVFDPHHGLFVYDEDSQYCYFNPYCFESSEQFFLVGAVLGLAIYNSTILDVALPPFAFKKLLAAAPHQNGLQTSTGRCTFKCTLDDLAEFRPALAKGLRMLLEFEGDVADTFCYDFVAQLDRYGERVEVPLCPDGAKRPVTNANRREFVDLYVRYLLDTAVARQFEPFKRGFFTVCGGNALSLFQPEEIELLVRGSDEPLDVASLRAVATYDNWSTTTTTTTPTATATRPEAEPVVRWFWDFFAGAGAPAQRKILSFITGSDRIPAMGATSLMIRLACLGDDATRYPTARTCFNTLGLYRYPTREKLEQMLWGAVVNSEGFGLK